MNDFQVSGILYGIYILSGVFADPYLKLTINVSCCLHGAVHSDFEAAYIHNEDDLKGVGCMPCRPRLIWAAYHPPPNRPSYGSLVVFGS